MPTKTRKEDALYMIVKYYEPCSGVSGDSCERSSSFNPMTDVFGRCQILTRYLPCRNGFSREDPYSLLIL